MRLSLSHGDVDLPSRTKTVSVDTDSGSEEPEDERVLTDWPRLKPTLHGFSLSR